MGLSNELRKRRSDLRPEITGPAEYGAALQDGYVAALEYLLTLRKRISVLSPTQINKLHETLFQFLYLDAGKLRRPGQQSIFGQRLGADPRDLVDGLNKLHEQVINYFPHGLPHPQTEADRLNRLLFIANYHGALVMLHPYRDGNGRLARLIAFWQEYCLVGLPRHAVARAAYMAGMRALPQNLRLLLNYFLLRHGLPITSVDPLPPLFPVWQPPSETEL